MTNNEIQSLGDIARVFGCEVMDETLSERLGIAVIDGRKVADDGAEGFIESVRENFDVEVTEWSKTGSAWIDDVIFIGADVSNDVRNFVAYHEFKHWLDYVGRGIVPADEHTSVRSSRIEKECDLYALRRIIQEMGTGAAEKAVDWMVNYHFQWDIDHPDDPSDLLYRAILLYRFCRRQGRVLTPKSNMRDLQRSRRWWR